MCCVAVCQGFGMELAGLHEYSQHLCINTWYNLVSKIKNMGMIESNEYKMIID